MLIEWVNKCIFNNTEHTLGRKTLWIAMFIEVLIGGTDGEGGRVLA